MRYKIVRVSEMVAIEQAADRAGYGYDLMMARAGLSLAEAILEVFGTDSGRPIVVGLIGTGNNGGDALVAMGHLLELGWECQAYLAGSRDGDSLVERFQAAGGKVLRLSDDRSLLGLQRLVLSADILIDGLLGTGIRLPLRPPVRDILLAVNDCLQSAGESPFIVAVDCPSGVDCDSGEAADECLEADLTVCMVALKQGLTTMPAFGLCGEITIGEIGLPPDLPELAAITRYMIDAEGVRDMLPLRPLDGHKGTFGKALVIGGSRQYPGAPILAGKAAFRSGSGWVELAVPGELLTGMAGSFLEATWVDLDLEGIFTPKSVPAIQEAVQRADSVLIGPGLGLDPETEVFFTELVSNVAKNLVLDADGLNHLVQIPEWWDRLPGRSILTPHPGEMGVLTGMDVGEIQGDRMAMAEGMAKKWGHIVVLKGAFTVVAAPEGRSATMPLATPALAWAGSGDVLAGVICGLLAQGMEPFEAAVCGVWLHGQAGLAAAESVGGTAGVLAGDLIEQIPRVLNE